MTKNTETNKIAIDWDLCDEYLKDHDLTENEKKELVEALWLLVVSYIDLEFGTHAAQLATKKGCEQIVQQSPSISPDMLNYQDANQIEQTSKTLILDNVSTPFNGGMTNDR